MAWLRPNPMTFQRIPKTERKHKPKVLLNMRARSVILSKEILEWINEQIEKKHFSNVSHALEYAIYQLMKREETKK